MSSVKEAPVHPATGQPFSLRQMIATTVPGARWGYRKAKGLVRRVRQKKQGAAHRLKRLVQAVRSGRALAMLGASILYVLTIEQRNRPARRSLWAGTPILTLPVKAKAERLLGVRADSLVYVTYFITRGFKYNLQPYMRGPVWWQQKVLPMLVLLWACLRYQRFHFFCDRGILPATGRLQVNIRELQLLRFLGKEIFFYAYGADVRTQKRTQALGKHNCCTECPHPQVACVCYEEIGLDNFARLRQYATAIFSMGDMIEYTEGSRNDLYYWPLDLKLENGQRYRPVYPDARATHPIKIVHAPNHRSYKGSEYLIRAVGKLRAMGYHIDLQLVERVPNREALEIYRQADIVFDQCLIGFHGYFALEAMAMGKPVMAFIRDPQRYLLHPDECPIINTPADELLGVLENLITNRQRLHDIGVQSRKYIEKCYSLEAFAGRMKRTYRELGLLGPNVVSKRAA